MEKIKARVDMDRIVSVIVRTKNRCKELKKALESIFEQSYQNFEIIVIDSSDTDYENEIKSFFKFNEVSLEKLKYFFKKELSSVQLLNFGIEKSKGHYIAFLDDDDVWLSTKIEKQLTLIGNGTILVGCWIDDRRFKKPYIIKCEEDVYLKELLNKFNFLATSAYVFDAKWLKQNLFDEAFPSAQDYELAIRACMTYPLKCYPEVLVIQYKSKNQITKDWRKKKQGLKLLLIKYKNLYRDDNLGNYINFRLKFFVLQCIYSLAYVFGERVYKIIIPLKRRG